MASRILFPLRRAVIVRTHDVFDGFADQLIANAAMSFRQRQVGEHDPPFAIGDEHLLLGGVERTQEQTPVGREHIRHDESRICRIQHQYPQEMPSSTVFRSFIGNRPIRRNLEGLGRTPARKGRCA